MTLIADMKPELKANTLILRPYQEDAINAIRERFLAKDRRTLLVMPTGTGKTATFGHVARAANEKGNKVLVIAHRNELISQAVNTLDRIGIEAGVEKAESQARAMFDPDTVVASVQTMQRKRLESWAPDHFSLIIIDEAHHATATTYQRVLTHFNRARVLGVTATADRADDDNLGRVFESVAYELSLWDAMTAPPPGPYLCKLRVVQCDVQIDLRDIRTTGGDFNQADLEERIRPLIDELANAIRQEIGERKTLLFTPDVGSAQAMASALRSLGLAADWIAGDSRDRDAKLESFDEGLTQVLCNCALLTEGFDQPDVSAIVLCRPTKSRPLYAQMVGRGTRLAKDKADCLIIDFDYLTSKHDLVRPVELFDTNGTSPDDLDAAQEILKNNPKADLLEAIEQGRQVAQERRKIEIRARLRKVDYKRLVFDPAVTCDILGIPYRPSVDAVHIKATPKQVDILTKFGFHDARNMSRRRASELIGACFVRKDAKLASYKQVKAMIRWGVDPEIARTMPFLDASKTLDGLIGPKGGNR